MRLIDANKFQKELSNVWKWLVERDKKGYGTTHGECLDKIHDILIKQPTAYDVDKVAEQLDKASGYYECEEQGREHIQMVDLTEAIEIIKTGGLNKQ